MASVPFTGALSYAGVTNVSRDIWYLTGSSRPISDSSLRVVHVLDAASPRTEICTVAFGPLSLVESAGADQRGIMAKPTIIKLWLGNSQVVSFLCVLLGEQWSGGHDGTYLQEFLHEFDYSIGPHLLLLLLDANGSSNASPADFYSLTCRPPGTSVDGQTPIGRDHISTITVTFTMSLTIGKCTSQPLKILPLTMATDCSTTHTHYPFYFPCCTNASRGKLLYQHIGRRDTLSHRNQSHLLQQTVRMLGCSAAPALMAASVKHDECAMETMCCSISAFVLAMRLHDLHGMQPLQLQHCLCMKMTAMVNCVCCAMSLLLNASFVTGCAIHRSDTSFRQSNMLGRNHFNNSRVSA